MTVKLLQLINSQIVPFLQIVTYYQSNVLIYTKFIYCAVYSSDFKKLLELTGLSLASKPTAFLFLHDSILYLI